MKRRIQNFSCWKLPWEFWIVVILAFVCCFPCSTFGFSATTHRPRLYHQKDSRTALFYTDNNDGGGSSCSENSGASRNTPMTTIESSFSSSVKTSSFQSTTVTIDDDNDASSISDAVSTLLVDWKPPSQKQQAIAFLFVSPSLAEKFESLVQYVQEQLLAKDKASANKSKNLQLISIVGGGVIGSGNEFQASSKTIAFLGGILPKNSRVELNSRVPPRSDKNDTSDEEDEDKQIRNVEPSSHLVFADPTCAGIQPLLETLQDRGGIVAGGISIATHQHPKSLALGSDVLPPGSLIWMDFYGRFGIQVIMAKGCGRPVGPAYRVTKVDGPVLHELNGERALDQLELLAAEHANQRDQESIRNHGVLGGVYPQQTTEESQTTNNDNNLRHEEKESDESLFVPDDKLLLRQVTGFRPRSGSIVVCGQPQLREGDVFRFHVRSKESALQDWNLIHDRIRTERLFLERHALGTTVAALQISCLARGKQVFGKEGTNVDSENVQELFLSEQQSGDQTQRGLVENNQEDQEGATSANVKRIPKSAPPVAGFFANAEIGPSGSIWMGIQQQSQTESETFLHGFTTVVAMFCDYTNCTGIPLGNHNVAGATSLQQQREVKTTGTASDPIHHQFVVLEGITDYGNTNDHNNSTARGVWE